MPPPFGWICLLHNQVAQSAGNKDHLDEVLAGDELLNVLTGGQFLFSILAGEFGAQKGRELHLHMFLSKPSIAFQFWGFSLALFS